VFEAAVEGWYTQCQAELERARKRILKSAPRNMYLSLEAPKDHTRDYDRAIAMVEMHQGETIQLTEEDVAQYIQDDWRWKRAFINNSSSYAAATVAEVYGDDEE
jgi:hypothetical protein